MLEGNESVVLGLWGYARANPIAVAILVGLVVVFAIIYVIARVHGIDLRRRRSEADKGPPTP